MIGLEMNPPTVLRSSSSRTWLGWWPGVVVDAADPERRARVRVRVPQVYGSEEEDEFIPDDELPFALPNGHHYNGSGDAWVPPVGATVWVGFIAGDHSDPIYQGGWAGEDDPIPEHQSSYEPGGGPSTRVIKTENGHIFEMRWKTGESEIRLVTENGVRMRLVDDPALGGMFAEVATPGGRRVKLDDTLQRADVLTPTQSVILDDIAQAINITTPGAVNVTAGGAANITAALAATLTAQGITLASTGAAPTVQTGGGTLTSTFVGAALYTFLGALTYAVTGIYALTAVGFTLTAASAAIVTTGTPVVLGTLAGIKRRLANEQMMQLLQDMLFVLENHVHPGVTAGAASTGVSSLKTTTQAGVAPRAGGLTNLPAGLVSLDVNAMVTQNVQAD